MNQRIFLTIFLTIMATALGASLVVPLLPVYAQSMGASGFELGLIFSGFALARLIFLPIVGSLSDAWGRRGFMLLGLISFTLTAIGFVAASNVAQLVFCRLLQGVGAAMVIPVARAYAGDLAEPGQEGRMMGYFNIAFFGGLALGPWLGGFIKDVFGLSFSFYSMGLLSLAGFTLALLYLPQTSAATSKTVRPETTYLELMHDPRLFAMFLFRFGSIIGLGFNWTFLPLLAHDIHHLSATRIGVLISVTVVMTTLLQPLFGPLADRVNRIWMAFWGGALASLGLLVIPFCQQFYQLLILNLMIGSAIGLYMPPLMAMAVDMGRETGFMTRVMSLLEMSFSCGMVVGPLMAGLIKEVWGLKAIFWIGGGIGLMAGLLFLLLNFGRVSVRTGV